MKTKKLTYPSHYYSAWKRGQLHYKWVRQFRSAFDKDDLRIVRNKHENGNHFGEWFTAIHYAKKGYVGLVEKYIYKIHSRKREVILRLLGERGLGLLRKWRKLHHCQPPDLLVFRGKTCFFVEVKRGRDFLRDCQKRLFAKIERTLGRRVIIVDLQAKH